MSHDGSQPSRQLILPACLGDSTNVRWREASSTPYVTDLSSLRMSITSARIRCRTGGYFFRFEASGCPLPTTAPRRRSLGAQSPYGQPQRGVLPFQVSRTICGHHQPSATMETGMRYQADIDALRRRQRRQLSRPGRLPAPACHRWRLSAAHQMRPPCNGQLGRHCRMSAS